MFDTKNHQHSLVEHNGYKALRLYGYALIHRDEHGVCTPPSKVDVRRALAGKNEDEATVADTETAIRHLVSMGALMPGSSQRRLILTGAEVEA